jgi:hypothetical protein
MITIIKGEKFPKMLATACVVEAAKFSGKKLYVGIFKILKFCSGKEARFTPDPVLTGSGNH